MLFRSSSRIGLGLIADATGTTPERIKQLNPALLGKATPEGPYSLRIPRDTAGQFDREMAAIPEPRRQSWRRHQVHESETLTQIAAAYKVKPAEILVVNNLGAGGPLPGDRLTIPVPYRPEVARVSAAPAGTGTHTLHYRVRPGDSLGAIARRYHVTIAQLQKWNGLKRTQLQAGEVLSVRVVSARPSAPGRPGVATRAEASQGSRQATAPRPARTAVARAAGASAN